MALKSIIKIKNPGIGSVGVLKLLAVAGWSKKVVPNPTVLKNIHPVLNAQACEYKYLIDVQEVNKNKQKELKTYKGVRYIKNLPARGQRTHTNAQTIRKKINV